MLLIFLLIVDESWIAIQFNESKEPVQRQALFVLFEKVNRGRKLELDGKLVLPYFSGLLSDVSE